MVQWPMIYSQNYMLYLAIWFVSKCLGGGGGGGGGGGACYNI